MPYEALDDMDGLDYNTSGFRCKKCGHPTFYYEEYGATNARRSKPTVVLSCKNVNCELNYCHKANANRTSPKAGRIGRDDKWTLNKKLEEI